MELPIVRIDKPATTNFILGQTHFIKTVEDGTQGTDHYEEHHSIALFMTTQADLP